MKQSEENTHSRRKLTIPILAGALLLLLLLGSCESSEDGNHPQEPNGTTTGLDGGYATGEDFLTPEEMVSTSISTSTSDVSQTTSQITEPSTTSMIVATTETNPTTDNASIDNSTVDPNPIESSTTSPEVTTSADTPPPSTVHEITTSSTTPLGEDISSNSQPGSAQTDNTSTDTSIPVVTTTDPSTTGVSSTSSQPPQSQTTITNPITDLELEYRFVADGLGFPIFMTALAGEEVSYLATKEGRVFAYENGEFRTNPVLDLTDRVRSYGEQGLLGLAIHPIQPERLFIHYTAAAQSEGDTILAEFRFSDPYRIDRDSQRVLLQLSQPANNHNGGMIQMTSDGLLWMAIGDGGGANDRFGHGQRQDNLWATIIRIDPDGQPYSIPDDNPFADGGGAEEIWGWGLRNPWRFWIDEPEGLIYIADVGQNTYEEINIVSTEPEGLNFGWPITEGHHCFSDRSCDPSGTVLPQVDLVHGDSGTCSVTGGLVYRGRALPTLQGHYLYSDYCGGYLRSFRWADSKVSHPTDWTNQIGRLDGVSSFGSDGEGEVYLLTIDSVYQLVATE